MGNVYGLLIKLVYKLKKNQYIINKIQHITLILHNRINVWCYHMLSYTIIKTMTEKFKRLLPSNVK